MHREIYQHKIAYFILSVGLIALVISFMAAWPNTHIQRQLILAMVIFYVSWGILTHKVSGNLSRKIIEEYAVVAAVAAGMLLIITF